MMEIYRCRGYTQYQSVSDGPPIKTRSKSLVGIVLSQTRFEKQLQHVQSFGKYEYYINIT